MDDDKSWYQKLAEAGWLGTRPQVSAKYGSPVWKSGDATGEALKRLKDKQAQGAPDSAS